VELDVCGKLSTIKDNVFAMSTPENENALSDATLKGNITEVKRFISLGADVNAFNSKGETPAHVASRYGHAVVVKVRGKREA